MTTGGGALGTMPYMSPEQALRKPMDARSDLFSFGVTLYEIATGKMPFQGDTTGVLFLSIVRDAPVPTVELNPDVPDELQRIIEKCLEKDRDLRYQHASDIRSDLKRLGRIRTPPQASSRRRSNHLQLVLHQNRYAAIRRELLHLLNRRYRKPQSQSVPIGKPGPPYWPW